MKNAQSQSDAGQPSPAKLWATLTERVPELSRFTDDDIELIYAVGAGRYQQGDYAKALETFTFVTLYRPVDPRYVKALAAALLMNGMLSEAASAYGLAASLAPEDADIQMGMAQCKARLAAVAAGGAGKAVAGHA